MINALFIGGPADGKRMTVGDDVQRITVPQMPAFDSIILTELNPDSIPVIQETKYHRHDFLALPGIAVFTVGEMATIDILEQLIPGYRDGVAADAE